ncbi:MAG TPA: CoA transferase [Tepidiformaceae bacterium]|nr:CoA transferase [Tepidiformaceae bacterium]
MSGPFEGIRVIDFTQGIGGPIASMLLADFGAEVIKVEAPGGDRMKTKPGYLCWNRNKQRVVLDIHRFDGLRATRELLATADVAVFDWAPGELERFGLDAVSVRARYPAVLHAWLPPYSPAGRWSQLPPHDQLLHAVSGVAAHQMSYADRPVHLVTPQVSYAQGMLAAGAIGSALYERSLTGEGSSLVISGLHAVASVHTGLSTRFGETRAVTAKSSRGGVPNYRLYQGSDGQWLFLGTLTPPFFLKALEAMDLMDLIVLEGVDGEFTKLLQPPMNAVAIERLNQRFAEKPRDEWLRILNAADVPCGPAGRREDWFRSETVTANEMRVELQHPTFGTVTMPGVSAKLSETPGSVRHLMQDVTVDGLPPHRPAGPPASPKPPSPRGPLGGIRVLDLGAFIAGPFAPTILASFGADVIKLEGMDGDAFRLAGMQFCGHNRGKRGLCIDLKSDAGREAFYDLVRVSDVVLDNYRAGVRERLGIEYERLAKINPRIISCSVSGYGPKGPLSKDPGFDPLLQARSGMMAGQGGEGEPVFHSIAVNDSGSAMMAVFGIVAALNARERTGRGQDVQTCLANQSVWLQSGELTSYDGRPANPVGATDCIGVAALQRFYECADGWIVVAVTRPAEVAQFALALGHPEWSGGLTAEQALAEPVDGRLAGQIAEALKEMAREEAVDRLLSRGLAAAPSHTMNEFFEDPWVHENGYFDRYANAQWGEVTGPAGYGDFGGRGGFERGAPALGEHTVEVLNDCGFEPGRIAELLAAGVVRQAVPE